MFETHREVLLRSLDTAHAAYYRAETFGGPSLHFHLRALNASKAADFEQFVESSYAVLTAWGMHRMGPGGAKMCDFEIYKKSLKSLWPAILRLQKATPESLDDDGWQQLEELFRGIKCMATRTSLVGHSKVMAHALPHLVAPVDRWYTLQFLFKNGNIANDPEEEWQKMREILRDFFYPILRAKDFKRKATEWESLQASKFRWDTSPLKIADNLVIGLQTITNEEKAEKASRRPALK